VETSGTSHCGTKEGGSCNVIKRSAKMRFREIEAVRKNRRFTKTSPESNMIARAKNSIQKKRSGQYKH